MKRITGIFCFTILLSLCLGLFGFVYADQAKIAPWEIDLGVSSGIKNPVKLFLGEKQILTGPNDVKPVIIRGRTLVPARAVFEAMGYKVDWIELQRVVVVTGHGREIRLTLDSSNALVDNVEKTLDVPAMIVDHDRDGNGSTMIPLAFTAGMLGGKVEWIGQENKVIIAGIEVPQENPKKDETPNTEIKVDPKEDELERKIIAEEEAMAKKLVTPAWDASVWSGEMLNENAKDKIVVIDIGHGGKDRGAVGHENKPDQLLEKDANFKVGLKLYQNLAKAGAKVYLTRDKDIYYTLKERAYMANGIKATVFVSIHNNSSVSPKPHGTETIYNTKLNKDGKSEMDLYGIASKDIAKNVQREMVEELGTFDRGTKNRPELGVVRRTKMPAIIVEGAFLSNEEDFARMNQTDFSDKYATAVARGIIKSLNEAYK